MLRPLLLLFCLFYGSITYSQSSLDTLSTTAEIYRVNSWISAGITAVGLASNSYRFRQLQRKPELTQTEIDQLDRSAVPGFDRIGLRQHLDQVESATRNSNIILWTSTALPLGLFLDRRIRQDWFDISLLYLQTQAIASNFYAWSPLGPTVFDRLRPRAYYDELPLAEKESGGTRNSFFSGHASSTAVGSFFFAKVLTDYHPEWSTGRKALVYSLASVPPILVSIERVRALRHWPSDTIVGSLVGAGIGLLIPHLHQRWAAKHRSRLLVNANYGAAGGGLGLQLQF
ncbi:MAG: phosphatase PAP2 family protein [Bacteroidota bacterium]